MPHNTEHHFVDSLKNEQRDSSIGSNSQSQICPQPSMPLLETTIEPQIIENDMNQHNRNNTITINKPKIYSIHNDNTLPPLPLTLAMPCGITNENANQVDTKHELSLPANVNNGANGGNMFGNSTMTNTTTVINQSGNNRNRDRNGNGNQNGYANRIVNGNGNGNININGNMKGNTNINVNSSSNSNGNGNINGNFNVNRHSNASSCKQMSVFLDVSSYDSVNDFVQNVKHIYPNVKQFDITITPAEAAPMGYVCFLFFFFFLLLLFFVVCSIFFYLRICLCFVFFLGSCNWRNTYQLCRAVTFCTIFC